MASSTLLRRQRPLSSSSLLHRFCDSSIYKRNTTSINIHQIRSAWRVLSSTSSSSSTTSATATSFDQASFPSIPTSTGSSTHGVTAATTTTTTSTEPSSVSPPMSTTKAYSELAKAKLSALVVTTTAAGFVAAGGPNIDPSVVTSCLVGTALCSSSAAAWNQIFEIDRDARMKRTQQRPLVQNNVLSKSQAQLAATVWGISGTTLLALGTDPLTATLGLSNIVLYAGLYTWMKPRSIYNTWVGAVVGAIPPVMGYTAATAGTGLFDVDCILLGTTLYLWQMPHFFALSYMHRLDYARGGFVMLPLVDEERTSRVILKYAAYLSAVPFVSTAMGVTSSMFALEGIALNSYAMYVAYRFHQHKTNANARKIFLTSLWYLPSLLMLFLLHSKVWDEDENDNTTTNNLNYNEQNRLRETLQHAVHTVRDAGRKACLHEQVIIKRQHSNSSSNNNNNNDDDTNRHGNNGDNINDTAKECPIVMTKRTGEDLQSKATELVAEHTPTTTSTIPMVITVDTKKS
ncbi:protoheme IX farnesyltransferase [Nitzschia inconspicua]|uniref:Heme O synthase n=1 Tax=Nitzschia inconspicua TaxID=303405 RepID=A0A9K3PBR2_9STRA|nr:protoheme IX farnesyltransferase [Nitzschia inconspicua]